jgi:hypothetical protein
MTGLLAFKSGSNQRAKLFTKVVAALPFYGASKCRQI